MFCTWINIVNVGNFKVIQIGFGGWIFIVYWFYDVLVKKFYYGDGRFREVEVIVLIGGDL